MPRCLPILYHCYVVAHVRCLTAVIRCQSPARVVVHHVSYECSLLYYSLQVARVVVSSQDARVLSLTHAAGITRVELAADSVLGPRGHFAGQYVFLCIPAIAPTEWHPFTISNEPAPLRARGLRGTSSAAAGGGGRGSAFNFSGSGGGDGNGDDGAPSLSLAPSSSIVLHIKNMGHNTWSGRLAELALAMSAAAASSSSKSAAGATLSPSPASSISTQAAFAVTAAEAASSSGSDDEGNTSAHRHRQYAPPTASTAGSTAAGAAGAGGAGGAGAAGVAGAGGAPLWGGASGWLSGGGSPPGTTRTSPSDIAVSVDGAYGRAGHYSDADTLILVAGGIGVTPMHAVFMDLYARAAAPGANGYIGHSLRRVHLVWVSRDEAMFGVFASSLACVAASPDPAGDGRVTFSVHLHCTHPDANAPPSLRGGTSAARAKSLRAALTPRTLVEGFAGIAESCRGSRSSSTSEERVQLMGAGGTTAAAAAPASTTHAGGGRSGSILGSGGGGVGGRGRKSSSSAPESAAAVVAAITAANAKATAAAAAAAAGTVKQHRPSPRPSTGAGGRGGQLPPGREAGGGGLAESLLPASAHEDDDDVTTQQLSTSSGGGGGGGGGGVTAAAAASSVRFAPSSISSSSTSASRSSGGGGSGNARRHPGVVGGGGGSADPRLSLHQHQQQPPRASIYEDDLADNYNDASVEPLLPAVPLDENVADDAFTAGLRIAPWESTAGMCTLPEADAMLARVRPGRPDLPSLFASARVEAAGAAVVAGTAAAHARIRRRAAAAATNAYTDIEEDAESVGSGGGGGVGAGGAFSWVSSLLFSRSSSSRSGGPLLCAMVCGPDPMIAEVSLLAAEHGADFHAEIFHF